jgi:Ulp1 family protease
VEEINFFKPHFVLQERRHEHLRQTDKALLRQEQYYGDCPSQLNGFDCGLFTIGLVLHLAKGKDITARETFTHQHITKLQSDLAGLF